MKVELEVGRRDGQASTEERTRRRRARSQQPPTAVTKIVDVEIRADPATGRACAYVFAVPGDPNSREAERNEQRTLDAVARYGVCSNSPSPPPRPRAQRPSPEAAAAASWRDHVTLPDPVPHVAPGWAVTGRRAYLEVGGPAEAAGSFVAFGYAVEVLARPAGLTVDWGDGTVVAGTTARPGPWPDGEVSHVYRHTGRRTVTVTRHWTATWRIGDATGTITEPLATTATLELDVRELQAVRNR